MASARSIRQQVREDQAAELKRREDLIVAVAKAADHVEQSRRRLAAAEQAAGAAARSATTDITLTELARYTGLATRQLRRWTKLPAPDNHDPAPDTTPPHPEHLGAPQPDPATAVPNEQHGQDQTDPPSPSGRETESKSEQ